MQLEQIKSTITPILLKHQVRRAGIFGSFATNQAGRDSDIDILVELGTEMSLLDFVGIKLELEDQLHRAVDLVEYQAIKPALQQRILAEEVRIYG